MPFRMVSVVGRGMGVLDGGGDRQKKGSLGVNFGRPAVTNGYFVAQLCESDALFPNYFWEHLFQFLVDLLATCGIFWSKICN